MKEGLKLGRGNDTDGVSAESAEYESENSGFEAIGVFSLESFVERVLLLVGGGERMSGIEVLRFDLFGH